MIAEKELRRRVDDANDCRKECIRRPWTREREDEDTNEKKALLKNFLGLNFKIFYLDLNFKNECRKLAQG